MKRSQLAAFAAVLTTSVLANAATELSVWALQDDLGITPMSIAYNEDDGKLLIAGTSIVEWEKGASSGTELVASADWPGSSLACVYIPSRGSYMVANNDGAAIYEVMPGVATQIPALFVDVDATNPYEPQGGMPTDGTYAYYKAQWTGLEQTVRRFALVGTNGADDEYIPYSAFQAWNSSGPSQEMAMDSEHVLYLSARTSTTYKANRGIYRWDVSTNALVPVIQEAAIKAHTGQSNVIIYGMTFDALDNFYFYDIYSASILRIDRHGNLSTFLTNDEVRDFMGDPEMQVHPSYMTAVGTELVFISGNVSGHILAARLPLEPEMVTIPGADYEVNGPTYSFEIGKYEITNAQYCMFLNDAELIQQTDPNDPRCTNMWFAPSNGDVYMMDVTVFPTGSEWSDRTLYKTSDILDSKIKYDISKAPGSRYYVIPGSVIPPYEVPHYEDHPVGTVSWFGAAKYCNWLTITSGLAASEVCYHEGTSKYDWYAITASDWGAQGMLESERLELVRDYRGYRLPMDGVQDIGTTSVATYWNVDANPYNEWYKAAAFDPAAPDTVRPGPGDNEMVQPDHWVFGYGDDINTNADANISNSGDPFMETTPIGWYDGVNLLANGTPTNDTRNRYGLYDMCGNGEEWINDTFRNYPWDTTYRASRGGGFSSTAPKYATASSRRVLIARYFAENSVSFRVVRSFGYGDFDADGDVDTDDYTFFAQAMTGPSANITPGYGYEACDYNGDDHVDLLDFAVFAAAFVAQ